MVPIHSHFRGVDPIQHGLLSQRPPGDVTAAHRTAVHEDLAALRHLVDLVGCRQLRAGYGGTFGAREKHMGCFFWDVTSCYIMLHHVKLSY